MKRKGRSSARKHKDGAANSSDKAFRHNGDEPANADSKPSSSSFRQHLEHISAEMEMLEYGKTPTGQKRRKLPRQQKKARTQQLKILEKQDRQMLAEEIDTAPTKRRKLRGSKAAEREEVLNSGYAFAAGAEKVVDEEGTGTEHSNEDDEDYDDNDEKKDETDEEDENLEIGGLRIDDEESDGEVQSGKKKKQKQTSQRGRSAKPKKRVFRMRNFTSQRLAQRHGEALGAHARGQPKVAIDMLKKIAREAPSAPQVYSSLGLVYEDMLREAQKKNLSNEIRGKTSDDLSVETTPADNAVPDKSLAEQLELARKAYGAYHIAAILCKKDYTLWVRAASVAQELADLHTDVMLLPDVSEGVIQVNRAEKSRWLAEAKSDYQAADNLRPPGIEVPAKLAELQIELGLYTDALTLLTDLISRGGAFDSSFRGWMLYADLLLRIGYECEKWNAGNETNKNHMFRRWLRRLSKSFDWKERRLQALAKAFESAAGSRNCAPFIAWVKGRATGLNNLKEGDDDINLQSGVADTSQQTESEFVEEKNILLEKNRAELSCFDMTSEEMSRDGLSAGARQEARKALLSRHKQSVLDFVGNYENQKFGTSEKETATSTAQNGGAPTLSPSASCRSVSRIAFLLCRHLIDMRLYTGGRLVGESASLFFKERAGVIDRRLAAKERRQAPVAPPTSIFGAHPETYDAEGGMSDEEEYDISDDDELLASSTDVLGPLRAGILPPELNVLWGLCLAGEGGKAFVAVKCIESVGNIAMESLDWLRENVVDTSVDADPNWICFREEYTGFLGRVSALSKIAAFVLDGHLNVSEGNLSQMFSRSIEDIEQTGFANEAVETTSPALQKRRESVFSILLVSAKAQSIKLDTMRNCNDELANMIVQLLDSLAKYLKMLWRVESNGSLSSTCIEVLSLLSTTLQKSELILETNDCLTMKRVIDKMAPVISILASVPDLKLSESTDDESSSDFRKIPFHISWMTNEFAAIANKTHNCLIATNVSHFSGWENDRFAMSLLKTPDVPYFFGVSQTNKRITGFVDPSTEELLCELWDAVQEVVNQCELDCRDEVSKLKTTNEHIQRCERHKQAKANHDIALYGENLGLSILLRFAKNCLSISRLAKKQDRLFRMAMAIILPASEFLLNRTLWSSTPVEADAACTPAILGQASVSSHAPSSAASTLVPPSTSAPAASALTDEQDRLESIPKSVAPAALPDRIRKRTAPSATLAVKSLDTWFSGENEENPLSNIIPVPCVELKSHWRTKCNDESADESLSQSGVLMEKVDSAVRKMKSCFSVNATAAAALEVAVALVELIQSPHCENPFLCLEQTAFFASLGPKIGSNDDYFKRPLPRVDECTVHDALGVLSRADCLQATYFFPEAAFLIGYLANVCALHRGGSFPHLRWDTQWKVLSLLTYNRSVLLRIGASKVVKEHSKKKTLFSNWTDRVISELKRARAEGLSWYSTVGLVPTESVKRVGSETRSADARNALESDIQVHSAQADFDSVASEEELVNMVAV